jgi:hypothetical protein
MTVASKVKSGTNGHINRIGAIGGEAPTNGAKQTIESTMPYVATVTINGTTDILFHRWNCEAVEAKSNAAKGSKARKTDDIETYVYRDENNHLCIPGEYLRGAIIHAAKYRQDPRSPRKSAMDLFKAGVVCMTNLSSTGKEVWDYVDMRRVTINRGPGITRSRPALKAGWYADFQLMINLPEYITPDILQEVISNAGKLIGIGDFRPTYGRFNVMGMQIGLD